METLPIWPLLALLGLGAAHGVNPGMGWLFAVALGLQEQKRSAVVQAVACLAAGHALAIVAAILLAATVGVFLPLGMLKWVVAASLLALGIWQLMRHGHPRYGGMTVGPRELTIWSFLMATVHGAGLMALPFVLGVTDGATSAGPDAPSHAGHLDPSLLSGALAGAGDEQVAAILSTLAHTAGYLLTTALIAVIVFEKVGLRMLGRVWINVRAIWAAALIVTAVLTPLIG